MRLPLHAWKNTLTSLGYRRQAKRKTCAQKRLRQFAIEQLDPRQMLTVSYSWDAGTGSLSVDVTGESATVSSILSSGQLHVKLNSSTLSVLAADVQSLTVNGTGSWTYKTIDLSGVTEEAFTSLTECAIHEDGSVDMDNNLIYGPGYEEGGTGSQTWSGGSRWTGLNVTISGSSLGGAIYTGAGDCTVTWDGNGQIASAWAGPGNNDLDVLGDGVILYGGTGDSVFRVTSYTDIIGGSGNNTYVFDTNNAVAWYPGVLGTINIHTDHTSKSNMLDFSAFTSVQPITLDVGSASQTVLTDVLDLTLEDDISSGDTHISSVIGGAGDDTITGDSHSNYLFGGFGIDTIDGGSGNDFLEGGAGDDLLTGGNGNDTFVFDPLAGDDGDLGHDYIYDGASSASDTLDFSNFADDQGIGDSMTAFSLANTSSQTVHSGVLLLTLQYSTSIENVIGGSGDDYITGNTQPNMLDGRDGDDTLIGGDGADRLYGGYGIDELQGNAGIDALYGQDGDDFLWGGTDKDYMYGGAGIDHLNDYDHSGDTTNSGNDHLEGGDGDDTLSGQDGNDELIGGSGDDDLYGGAGNDKYIYVWHAGEFGLGWDTIYESTSAGSDEVDLTQFFSDDFHSPNPATSGKQTVSDDQAYDPYVPGEDAVLHDLLAITFNTTSPSTVESVVDTGSAVPYVAGTSLIQVDDAGTVELSAYGVEGDPTSIDFYRDSDGNGVIEPGVDQFLGTDSDGTDGWSITLPYDDTTQKWIADDGYNTPVDFNDPPGGAGAGTGAVPFVGGTPGPASPMTPNSPPQAPGPAVPLIPSKPQPVMTQNRLDLMFANVLGHAYGSPTNQYTTPAPNTTWGTTVYKPDSGSIVETRPTGSGNASTESDVFGMVSVFDPSPILLTTGHARTESTAATSGACDVWSDATASITARRALGSENTWAVTPSGQSGEMTVRFVGSITIAWANSILATPGTFAESHTQGGVQLIVDRTTSGSLTNVGNFSLLVDACESTNAAARKSTLTMYGKPYKINPTGGSMTVHFDFGFTCSVAQPAIISLAVFSPQNTPSQSASTTASSTLGGSSNASAWGKFSFDVDAIVKVQ